MCGNLEYIINNKIRSINIDKNSVKESQLEYLKHLKYFMKNIVNLHKYIDNSLYDKCFLVYGSLGSGKTHFITTLLKQIIEEVNIKSRIKYILINLDYTTHYTDINSLIIANINNSLGTSYKNIEEINSIFQDNSIGNEFEIEDENNKTNVKLVITIDDLHIWIEKNSSFEEMLINYITGNTHLHSIYWLITIQDNRYNKLRCINSFWNKYAFEYVKPKFSTKDKFYPNLGKWFFLDNFNDQFEISLMIISNSININKNQLSKKYNFKNFKSIQYLTPFITWILVKLKDEINIDEVVNLVYINFVEKFWENKLNFLHELLESDTFEKYYLHNYTTIFNNTIIILSKYFAQTVSFEHPYFDLIKIITEKGSATDLKDEKIAILILNILEKANLLRYLPESQNNDEVIIAKLITNYNLFWEYQVVNKLIPQTINTNNFIDTLKSFQNWIKNLPNSNLKEEIGEFFIQLLITKNNISNEIILEKLFNYIYDAQELNFSSKWYAFAKAKNNTKVSIFKFLSGKKDINIKIENSIYSFMYFLVNLPNETVSPDRKLRFLQPHYKVMALNGLADYFIYFAEKFIAGIDDNKLLLECTKRLVGCEDLHRTEYLAEICAEALFNNINNRIDKIVIQVIGFVRGYHERINESITNKKSFPYYFYQWFLCKFCEHIVNRKYLKTYEFLNGLQWYYHGERTNTNYNILLLMREAANNSISYWYRKNNASNQNDYKDTINKFLDFHFMLDDESAYFLIRHTEPYSKGHKFLVDEIFLPELHEIYIRYKNKKTNGRGMYKIIENDFEFFKINLKDKYPNEF